MSSARNQKVAVFDPARAETSWEVRWSVTYGPKGARRRLQRSRAWPTKLAAQRFHADLRSAAEAGVRFDTTTGLPLGLTGASDTVVEFAVRWFHREVASGQWSAKTQDAHRDSLVHILRATCDATPPASVLKPVPGQHMPALNAWIRDALTPVANRSGEPPHISVVRAGEWLAAHSMCLDELDAGTIRRQVLPALRQNLDGTAAAAKSFDRRKAPLTALLNAAVSDGVIASSPATGIRLPRSQKASRRLDVRKVPTKQEWLWFICAACFGSDAARRHIAYLATVLYTGARPGELNGLRRSDLVLPAGDGEYGQMVVSESHTTATRRSSGSGVSQGPLKHRTPGTTRVVDLHPEVVALLRLHLELWLVASEHGFVFRSAGGGLLGQNMGRYLRAGRARMGWVDPHPFARATTYTGRHGFVSLMLHGGFDPSEVAEMVGNTPSVITDYYASVISTTRQERTRRMGDALD